MTAPYIPKDAPWTTSESYLISTYAYERFISVEPRDVEAHIVIWRQWYYGMVPDNAVMLLPGVHRIDVSGR